MVMEEVQILSSAGMLKRPMAAPSIVLVVCVPWVVGVRSYHNKTTRGIVQLVTHACLTVVDKFSIATATQLSIGTRAEQAFCVSTMAANLQRPNVME